MLFDPVNLAIPVHGSMLFDPVNLAIPVHQHHPRHDPSHEDATMHVQTHGQCSSLSGGTPSTSPNHSGENTTTRT